MRRSVTAHTVFLARVMLVTVFVIAAFVGLGATRPAHAATPPTTYYVSPHGNDSNNGTSSSTPWRTISHVDSETFAAGESILFQGGATFSGELYFPAGESGTSSSPITIGSYGTGDATINGGTGSSIYIYNDGGYTISNLNLVGSGASTDGQPGINFWNDDAGDLDFIYVNHVTASGFLDGLAIGTSSANSGYSNVTIDYSQFHNNRRSGIVTYGPTFDPTDPTYAISNIYVGFVTAYDNLGDSTLTGSNDSGNGVVLGSTNDGTVEYSSAYGNGPDCKASACGVGIWTYDSNDVTIRHNVSYDNQTGSTSDGDGFDLDQNTSHSVMEYNYSYNNAGGGYLLFGSSTDESHTGNTVRFNISQNDGRKNSFGGIELYGNVSGDALYNNTIYTSPSSSGTPHDLVIYPMGTGLTTIRNNIFYASGSLTSVYVAYSPTTAELEIQGNDYYSYEVDWNGTNYSSLSAWRSATGQEELNGAGTGFSANPDLAHAGTGTAITNPVDLYTLTQYELVGGSPMKNSVST